MVVKFNRVLKKYVLQRRESMIWVGDFFGGLLEDGKLKKAYELDGTHLSPNYIPLLVNELDRAIQ